MEEVQGIPKVETVTEVKEQSAILPEKPTKPQMVLTDNEKQIIEQQRREIEALEEFKTAYNELVQRTGFAWVVDLNTPINNLQLGVAKIRQ